VLAIFIAVELNCNPINIIIVPETIGGKSFSSRSMPINLTSIPKKNLTKPASKIPPVAYAI